MVALDKNESWDLVEFLTGRNPIGREWVFNKMLSAKGKVKKHKSWLVIKGYSYVEGIEFGHIFSPVARLNSIKFLLSIAMVFYF
jgi:hypothetical protein